MTLLHQAAQKAVEALSHAQQWIGSAPHGDNCYVSDHYEGDPGDRCNCGKESALSSVECALSALQQQEVPREPPESELVCYEAYAALGMFLMELAEGGHPQAEKLLDNLSQARLAHKDVLPFSPSTTQQQEAGNDALDARRYRWLRQYGLGIYWDVFSDDEAMSLGTVEANAARLDSAIDRVLAAAPSTPESAEKDDAGGGKEVPRG